METLRAKFRSGLLTGLGKGWGGFLWMNKILIPVSFLTMLLHYSGWVDRIGFFLGPAMGVIGLPSQAALPLIAGMLTGIYGGIAAMIMLPFTTVQMTLIAVFIMIAHNLIQEGAVQGKSGMHPLKATVVRLTAALVTVALLSRILGAETGGGVGSVPVPAVSAAFLPMLSSWARETFFLCVKIFFIIMPLMALLGVMKRFDLIRRIVKGLRWPLKLLGLDERVGILWLTAAVFGITYGAAVIVEESKEGGLSVLELERLHLSIGINHAMIEDPAVFLPLGIAPFWLWVPRLAAAVVSVHLYSLWRRIRLGRRPIASGSPSAP